MGWDGMGWDGMKRVGLSRLGYGIERGEERELYPGVIVLLEI